MKEHGGHENLCGSDRRSVIPYVHGGMRGLGSHKV
jgi:hypothetical protein